jgi:lipopolysaccharide/colanic/teichoic acid biosynthesis glycosyltransferase
MFGEVEEADLSSSLTGRPQPIGGLPKRTFDIVVSFAAIVAFLPLLALICVILKWRDNGPILFRQTRIGFGGRGFACYKFRSMVADADQVLERFLRENADAQREWEMTQKLKSDPRITPFGQFLRRTSLDELPQLFNVLVGDMSIVGPRPIVSSEIPRYGPDFEAYAATRPGLTGLWQVSGRNDCPYPERVALDTRYVRQWAFRSDLLLVAKTFHAVLARRGSY